MSFAHTILNETEDSAIAAIKEGADVNELDVYGMRPLTQAVIKNRDRLVKELILAGAEVDQQDTMGKSPLQWACDRGAIKCAKILLENGANPNHNSVDGKPILVNPILREELDIVNLLIKFGAKEEFAQDFISAKLLGHKFELTGETDIVDTKGVFIPLSFEGFYLEFSTSLLHRSLHNFVNSFGGHKYRDFTGKLQKILIALKNSAILASFARHKDKTPFNEQIEKILDQDLLLLPSAYAGHAITFIKHKNMWAKCDRGVNHMTDTVLIYEMGQPLLANKSLLEQILFEFKDKNFINRELKDILKLRTVTTLPTRYQIAGNCSWANVETSIPAMLYILNVVGKPHNIEEISQLRKDIYKFYCDWTEWEKDVALDEAIENFYSIEDTGRKISKAIILGNILCQRLNPNKRRDVKRAEKILKILATPTFSFILKNHRTIYNNPRAGKIGKDVIKLLKKCGLDIRRLKMNHFVRTATNVEDDGNIRMTTALHEAAIEGNIEAIKLLVEQHKLDVNYCDRTGSTALMYAAWKGHFNLVKIFIEQYNANPKIKNLKGGTALRYASFSGHTDIVNYLDS